MRVGTAQCLAHNGCHLNIANGKRRWKKTEVTLWGLCISCKGVWLASGQAPLEEMQQKTGPLRFKYCEDHYGSTHWDLGLFKKSFRKY